MGRLVLSTLGLSGEAWEAWGGLGRLGECLGTLRRGLGNVWECFGRFGEAWRGLGKAWGMLCECFGEGLGRNAWEFFGEAWPSLGLSQPAKRMLLEHLFALLCLYGPARQAAKRMTGLFYPRSASLGIARDALETNKKHMKNMLVLAWNHHRRVGLAIPC